MRILVTEDESLIALMLAMELESAGHRVIGPASTFAAALRLAEAETPDLALLDVNLGQPDRDGIDVAMALLERYGVRSLFVSGDVDRQRAMRAQPWGLLRKPYDPRSLLDTVRAIDDVMSGRTHEPRLPGYVRLPSPAGPGRHHQPGCPPQAASFAAGASS